MIGKFKGATRLNITKQNFTNEEIAFKTRVLKAIQLFSFFFLINHHLFYIAFLCSLLRVYCPGIIKLFLNIEDGFFSNKAVCLIRRCDKPSWLYHHSLQECFCLIRLHSAVFHPGRGWPIWEHVTLNMVNKNKGNCPRSMFCVKHI